MGDLARTFGVDWPHLVAQTISFSIVCALLYRFAYHPVLRMLETRRQQIAQGLENTAKINAKLAEIESERNDVIETARAEGIALVTEARAASKHATEQEAKRATVLADQIVARAHEQAAREHAQIVADARREIGRLVVQMTAAVSGKVLTANDQRRLVDETTRRIA